MATEPNGSLLLEPPETRGGLKVVSRLPPEGDFLDSVTAAPTLRKEGDLPDGLTVVSTLPQEGEIPHSSTEFNDESMQSPTIEMSVSDMEEVIQISPIKTNVTVAPKGDLPDGLTVVPTLPQEGDIPHSSTELNDESMQSPAIEMSLSDMEDVMQISPIKTSVSVKEDVMQISPLKTIAADKEDVMQISPIKTSMSGKDVTQISPVKRSLSDKEDAVKISPLKTTLSDIEDVNLISLKHPDTAKDRNPDVWLPESFSDKKIGMHQDILLGGNKKKVSSLCSDNKDEEEDHIEHVAKKLKTGKDTKIERRKSLDAAIKQTSEIVLVLAGMGRMRAGRPPTDFERGLMTEARQQLGYLAGKLAPKDLVSKDAVESMIEDLGLNRVKDPTKTAGPKKSIAERAVETMKKIEQARQLTSSAAMLSTSLVKAEHISVNPTSRGTSLALTNQEAQPAPVKQSASISQPLPAAQLFMPAISVTPQIPHAQSVLIEPRTPVVTTASVVKQVPCGPTSLVSQQAQVSLMAPVAVFPPVAQTVVTKSPVVALPATRVMQPVLEAQSLLLQKPGEVVKPLAAPGKGVISEENTKPLSGEAARAVDREHSKDSVLSPSKISPLVQTSTSSANVGKDIDVPAEIPRKLENLHTIQTPRGPKPAESLAIRANHSDIARNVQKILQSKPPDFRQWEPPSKAYMNAPILCTICKISMTDIDTILVCDACEKAVHLKCIQQYIQKGIPKGDWHCPRCLIASNGRPFPPKYGRVGKSTIVRKMPANKSSPQASPAKKMETSHPKSLQQTVVSNGLNTAPEVPIHVDRSNNKHILRETGNSSGDLRPNSEMSFAEGRKNSEDGANEPLNHEFSQAASEGVTALLQKLPENENNCSPSNTVSQIPNQQSVHSAAIVSASHFGSKGSQTKQKSSINLHVVEQPQNSSNSQGADRLKMQQETSASGTPLQNNEIQRASVESEGLPFSQFPMAEQSCTAIGSDGCQQGEDAQRRTLHKNSVLDAKSLCEGISQNRSTEGDDAYRVEWVGDKLKVASGKIYYQSCSARGVLYKLHDYALFRPETPNIPPYIARLQMLWEDDVGRKWARVSWCYYPNDIPQVVSRPTPPEKDEVYESNHGDNNLVGSVQGPCQVLSSEKYKEEIEKRMALLEGGHEITAFHPVFLCKWYYDAQKGVFHPVRH